MVLTRSHDHTPATTGKENASENGIDSVTPGKRKRQYDANAATPSQPAAKRRKAVEKLQNDIVSSPQIATAVVIEVVKHDSNGMRKMELSQSEPDARLQEVTEIAVPVSTTSPSGEPGISVEHINDPMTGSMSVALDQTEVLKESRKKTLLEEVNKPGQLPAPLGREKPLKNLTKVNNALIDDGTNEESISRATDNIKTTASPPNPPKRTHKRFDSAEPESFQPQPKEAQHDKEPPNDNLSDNSDDEAPETVTASSGQAQALTATLEQSKATLQLKKERKSRRRDRDAKLKEQAKSAAKRASKAERAPKSSKTKRAVVNDDTPTSSANPLTAQKPKLPLPALLPDNILTDEPPIRPFLPLPQPPTTKGPPNQKKKFPDLVPKRPKDIKKGGVRIRVLREANGMLPPKVSRQGRALREAWLMGQRGGGTVVERRKMKGQGGFVRR